MLKKKLIIFATLIFLLVSLGAISAEDTDKYVTNIEDGTTADYITNTNVTTVDYEIGTECTVEVKVNYDEKNKETLSNLPMYVYIDNNKYSLSEHTNTVDESVNAATSSFIFDLNDLTPPCSDYYPISNGTHTLYFGADKTSLEANRITYSFTKFTVESENLAISEIDNNKDFTSNELTYYNGFNIPSVRARLLADNPRSDVGFTKEDVDVNVGGTITVTLTLYGNPYVSENLEYSLNNGTKVSTKSNEQGQIIITNAELGNYVFRFLGNENYAPATITVPVINNNEYTVILNEESVAYTLTTSNTIIGNIVYPSANSISGKLYYYVDTDEANKVEIVDLKDSTFSFDLKDVSLSEGKHTIYFKTDSIGGLTENIPSISLIVSKASISIVEVNKPIKVDQDYYSNISLGDTEPIKVTSNNLPIVGITIKITSPEGVETNLVTDEDGLITYTFTEYGKYVFSYDEDNNYNGVSANIYCKIPTKFIFSDNFRKGFGYVLRLIDAEGNPVEGFNEIIKNLYFTYKVDASDLGKGIYDINSMKDDFPSWKYLGDGYYSVPLELPKSMIDEGFKYINPNSYTFSYYGNNIQYSFTPATVELTLKDPDTLTVTPSETSLEYIVGTDKEINISVNTNEKWDNLNIPLYVWVGSDTSSAQKLTDKDGNLILLTDNKITINLKDISGLNVGNIYVLSFGPEDGAKNIVLKENQMLSSLIPLSLKVVEKTITSVTGPINGVKGTETKITVNVVDGEGNTINEGTVTLEFNGQTYTESVSNGVATITLPDTLDVGKYENLKVTYSGTANYAESTSNEFTVQILTTNILVDLIFNGVTDTNTIITARLYLGDNTPISGESLTLNVNNDDYSGTTDGDGLVSFTIPANTLEEDTYTATIKYDGKVNTYEACQTTFILIMSDTPKEDTSISISSSDIKFGEEVIVKAIVKAGETTVTGGTVTYYVNGEKKETKNIGETYTFIPSDAGEYSITATFDGDETYAASNANTITIKVNPLSTTLTTNTVDSISLDKGGLETIILTLKDGESTLNGKTINILIDGVEQSETLTSDTTGVSATISANDLGLGEHTIVYLFKGTSQYNSSNTTVNVIVTTTPTIIVDNEIIGETGENTEINVVVLDGTPVNEGDVKISIGGVDYTGVIDTISGVRTITLPYTLTRGAHTLTVEYAGVNNKYNKATETFILKLYTVPTIDYIINKDDKTLTITINDKNNVLSTGTVTVNVGANTFTGTYNSGVFTVDLSSISDEIYTGTINYDAVNGEYYKDTSTNFIVDDKIPTNLKLSTNEDIIVYGENITVSPTLTSGATGTIDYYVDGVLKDTLNVGEVFVFKPTSPGTYKIKATYNGDDDYEVSNSQELKINVNKADTVIGASSLSLTTTESRTLTITLKDKNGNNLDGTLTVNIDNDEDLTVTIVNGVGSLSLSGSNLGVGTHSVRFAYNDETGYYEDSTKEISVSVSRYVPPTPPTPSKTSTSINGLNNDGIVTIILTSNNNPLNGETITVTIRNSTSIISTQNLTTNSNGQVSVDLSSYPNGDYIVSYSFSETSEYTSTNGSTSVNINKTNPDTDKNTTAILNVESEVTGVYGEENSFDGVLTDTEGNPIIGHHVAINITRLSSGASKVYWVTTDYLGNFNLPITLAPGYYIIRTSVNENNFTVSSISSLVIEREHTDDNRIATILQTFDTELIYGTTGNNFTGKLLDNMGNAITGQHIDLTLSNSRGQSKTYNVVSDYTGTFTLPINLGTGVYSVNCSYSGMDNLYRPSTSSNTLTVLKV